MSELKKTMDSRTARHASRRYDWDALKFPGHDLPEAAVDELEPLDANELDPLG